MELGNQVRGLIYPARASAGRRLSRGLQSVSSGDAGY